MVADGGTVSTIDQTIPIPPSSAYGCGNDECEACYGNEAYRLTLPAYWLAKLFEDEVCGECGGDEDDHDAVMFLGNYFARCRS